MRLLGNRYVLVITLVIIAAFIADSLWVRTTHKPLDLRLVKADNEFAFKLLKQVAKEHPSGNTVISPISITLSLHMTYNGAAGSTREAMAKTLCLGGMTFGEINHANATLLDYVERPNSGIRLDTANSLWADKDIHFKQPFMEANKLSYRAEVATLDLRSPSAVPTVNAWVKRQTGGMIHEVVQSLDPEAILLLINATYFKGEWTYKFNKSNTDEMPFYLANGRQKRVPTMHQKGTFLYSHNDWPQIIRLPYGNGHISMYIMLPTNGFGGQHFHLAKWDELLSEMQEVEDIDVYIPRFQIRYSEDLKQALSSLGMGIAFDPARANLSGICPPPAWIGLVQHDVMIEVNESGTEAAAVTDTQVFAGGHVFMANRPFFFAIRDDKTGLILFMGWVADPTEGMKPSD